MQPPSGGCVLKPSILTKQGLGTFAAAFGRLCVETYQVMAAYTNLLAAAFGRLCVETNYGYGDVYSGGSSRLRAAVC